MIQNVKLGINQSLQIVLQWWVILGKRPIISCFLENTEESGDSKIAILSMTNAATVIGIHSNMTFLCSSVCKYD